MRKIIAVVLCFCFMFLSMPNIALANDRAKEEFIQNYISLLNNSVELQNSLFKGLLNNTVNMNIDAELSDGTAKLSDGMTLSNASGQADLNLAFNLLEKKASLSFNGNMAKYNLEGKIYITEDGIIVTKETIDSLKQAGIKDFDGLETADTLPPYIVYLENMNTEEINNLDLALEQQVNLVSDKNNELKNLVREIFNIIPDSCYSYSGNYVVLDLDMSIFSSAALISNLKDNSENLADAFLAFMDKPASMSDEEYEAFKNQMKTEFIDSINSISISDVQDFMTELNSEMPISINKFQIKTSPAKAIAVIDISGNIEGTAFTLKGESKAEWNSDNAKGFANIALKVDSPNTVIDLQISENEKLDKKQIEADITIKGNLDIDQNTVGGTIKMDLDMDFMNNDKIVIPQLSENNSLVIDNRVTPAASGEVYPFLKGVKNNGKIKVFVYGEEISFTDAEPVIRDNRTLLPLNALKDALDCDLTWQPPDKVILRDKYDISEDMILIIGSREYQIGKETDVMETAPVIINNRTYVPVRFVAENFGFTVDWHQDTQSVILNW